MPPARAAAARFGRAALSSSRSVAEKQRRAILDASGDLGAALGVGGFGRELEAVMRRVLTSRLVASVAGCATRAACSCALRGAKQIYGAFVVEQRIFRLRAGTARRGRARR